MSAWWSFVRKPEAGSFALARLGRKRNPAAGSECGDVESVIIIIRIIRIITLLLLLLPPPSFKQQSVIMLIRAILLQGTGQLFSYKAGIILRVNLK